MQANTRSHPVYRALGPLLALVFLGIPSTAGAADLGSARLDVVGTRLTVSPEAQTVPYRTATIVETTLEGFDLAQGTLPPDLRVVGDFTGPEIDGVLRLETTPGEPFRIPRLSVEGQYQLDDIRLVQGDELLAYAQPRSAGVLVTQVLVTRVTSRALTLDEIRGYGLVIDDDNFHAFNFTFGFAVDGQVFDYNVPVIAGPGGNGGVTLQVLEGADPLRGGGRWGTTSARFRAPQLAPFTLELEGSGSSRSATGGCLAIGGCSQAAPVSLPGVILFPTDVSLLNQFFSVVVIAKNDAPAGDPLVIRDLTAKVSLPPGLRQAETEPPTPLGVPVPVRVPGADGELGTGDDITFLIAQAEGQAEVLVEGRKQGTHVVEFDLHGVLDGFPDGEIRKVTGKAKGAVVVRDPTLGLTISHPDTVRTDEEYSLFLTLSNTGNAPVNLLSLTLPTQQLSGVQVIGSNTQTIPTLGPGESDVVEFRLRSLRTGRVVASTVKAGSQVTPSFELAVGVGDSGIPLSPDAIVLPKTAELLPNGLAREALGMVGLGYSLATAPPSALRPELPWIELDRLHEKVYWLSQAGRHVDLGEELFDSVAVLAAEWTGARDADWEWDLLRRTTGRGAGFGTEAGLVLAAEASATSPDLAFERFAATTAFLGRLEGALVTGDGVSLSVASRTSGKTVSGAGDDPQRSRGLPFADLYDLGGAQMALLAVPEDGGYRVRLTDSNGGSASLRLLVPEADGTRRTVEWSGISLAAAGSATVDYRADDTSFSLQVDSDGDGVAEGQLTGSVSTVASRAFAVVGAAQDPVVVTGHTVEVLFTQDVDLRSLLERDPSHFVLPGKVSNGGLVESERDVASLFEVIAENPFEGLMNTRVVRVTFDNALSPYKTHDLAVNGVESVTGELVTGDVVTVETRVTDPGTIVQGTVYGPDGQPVPFAKVELLEADFFYFKIASAPCEQHRTALVEADAQGRFELDYVRQTQCGDLFRIRGFDPLSGHHGTSQGRVRFIGQTVQLDILMLGRGTVRGRVTYEDGTVPEELQVVGYSPVFAQGREAELGPDGTYEIRDLPVGTVSLGASDRIGSFVYQTVEIPRAGAVTQRDLVIFRRPSEEPTGDVRGIVIASDGTTPLFDAYVALYIDGELVGVERSDFDGTFDFGTVRAGVAEIEAFDGDTGRSGAQVYFDVQPDQVNDVTVLLQDDRGTVEGYVYRQTLSQTTPLAGAVVWVSGTPFNTVTDENGYYRLEGVYAGTRTVLAADLERQVQVSAQVTVSSDGQTVFRDLYFVESVGSGLSGEVLGLTGSPVAGATIHLADGHGGWWKEVTTDFNGRFTIPDLRPGGYEIHAIKGSLGAVATATIRFEGETPFVTIRFQRGTIRGSTQVIGESGQLTGVTSLVTYRTTVPNDFGLVQLDLQAHTLETAADGTFEIPDVLAGRYVVTVSNAFHGETTVRDAVTYDGEVRQHDFVFRESGTVRGTVLDWDGETPVAGALVNLRHPAFSVYDLTTDEEGRFTFELVPPRSRRFAVDAEIEQDGIFRTARIWVGLTRSGQELDTEIVLPMQGTVSGWVEDANGAPVPGAVVTLREGSYPNREQVHNADSEGNFSFTNIFVGDVSLSAQAPALGGLGGRDSVEIVEEQQEVFSLIVLEPTGEIEGTIFTPETGEEISTAQVSLHRWPHSRIFDSVTASEAEFRFRLLPLDLYRVRVFDPSTGRFGQSDWTLLETNGQILRIDVTLQARGDVDGHLTEPDSGLGVPGATIQLHSRSLRPFTTYSSTDVDGYFEFLGIPEGTFTLTTKEPDGRRLASGSGEIVEEDQRVTVDLVLEELGRVVGSVLNPPGLPDGLFANANVVLYESGRVVGASLDNPFTFDGVLSGRTLEVRAYENGGDHRANVKGKLQAGESEITLDLQMVARGSVAVTVLDSGGAPVAGATVSGRNKGYYGSKYLDASTGPDGRAVFTDIGAGWISVSASHPTSVLKGSAHGDLTLDGEQVELVVQLEPSGVIRGRALLSDGLTPAEEGLAVVTRGGRTLQLLVDANGDFEFVGVPLGSFTLFVQESFGPGTIERSGNLSTDGEVIDLGTLVLDDHDPAVFALAPTTGSADLPLSTVATVRFSEPIDVSEWSGTWITFRKVGGGSVAYTPSWSEGDTLLTLTPNNPLASFTAYDLIVNNAHDLAGRKLSVKGRTTFNTVDVVPPAAVDFLPREGDGQIPLDASILVTFSEPVAFGSLSGSALQLTDLTTGAGVTTTFQHLAGERQVLVTPASGLQANRQYQLTVQGVTDNGGNAMTAPASVSFWSVDLEPPEITSVVFPQGTSYTAGDEVPVQVTVTDEWGVASTELVIEGWTWSDDAEPWELTGVVPITAAAGQLTVEIRATDVHGNTGSVTRTLDVAPNPNAVDPAPTVACGREGGWVVPGYAVELGAVATDDETVESIALFVDDVEIGRAEPLASSPAAASFLWTPPTGAAPGTTFTARLEARDFAGNVGAIEITLTTPPASATVLTNGTTLFPSTYDGTDLVLASGTFTSIQPLDLASLTVARSARILPQGDPNVPIELTIAGQLDLQCGARIDVTGGGYPSPGTAGGNWNDGIAPAWVQPAEDLGGGSHGGLGTPLEPHPPSGETYGSLFEPHLGGASGSEGGPGGGIIRIATGALELDGEVIARAEKQFSEYGPGAGGSVWIETSIISGSGRVDAAGGDADGERYQYGTGGGGRIALHADVLDPRFDPGTQLRVVGGISRDLDDGLAVAIPFAASGTVVVKTALDPVGTLVVANDALDDGTTRGGLATDLPSLGTGAITDFAVTGTDAMVSRATPFTPRWIGAYMAMVDATGAELGTFRVDSVDVQGRAFLNGAGAITGATGYRGEWHFDRVEVHATGRLSTTDPLIADTLVVAGDLLANDVIAASATIEEAAVVGPTSGGSLRFEVSGTMTVEAGAVIDVTGLGYAGGKSGSPEGGTAPGLTGSVSGAGGSHGGDGGSGENGGVPGEVYDSVYKPRLSGGGGGRFYDNNYNGADGGGVVELDVGTLVLDGQVLARGEAGWDTWNSAGAGGTIVVRASSMTGSGLLDASGGDGVDTCGTTPGAGGGGRIALWVDDLSGFDVASGVRAWSGVRPDCGTMRYGATGTVYLREATDTYGRLRLDNGQEPDGTDRETVATELPALGTGMVTAFDVSGVDAWLTASVPLRERWLGAWMVLLDAGGVELGSFRVGGLDASGRILLEGAGSVTGAASYRGEYRFDAIETLHGAGLAATDPVSGSALVISGDTPVEGVVTASDVLVKSGAVVRPASGGTLRFEVSGTMTVEAGAVIDVIGLGYAGGVAGSPEGITAPGLTGSVSGAGGSHGGEGGPGEDGGVPGEVYDSVYEPRLSGGGGARYSGTYNGADGGGVVELDVGTLVLDGQILARGEAGWDTWNSGGAGGTIVVRASSMTGSGLLDASGGDGVDTCGTTPGAGGGGRIALWVDDLSGFDVASGVRAWSGVRPDCGTMRYGATGTVYLREATDTYGRLRLDNGQEPDGTDRETVATELPALGTGMVTAFGVSGVDAWLTASVPLRERWLGAWVVLLDAGGVELGSFRIGDLDASGRILLEGAGSVTGAASYRGEYRFDAIETLHGAGLESSDPVTGSTVVLSGDSPVVAELVATDLLVKSDAVVRPATGGALRFEVSGTMTVEAGAVIDVTGLGYAGGTSASPEGGTGPGLVGSVDRAGGSHGGVGGSGEGAAGVPGEVFDSVYEPRLTGGGGGRNGSGYNGAAGGGVVELEVGTLVLDGQVVARGQAGWDTWNSGGAGGTIVVRASSMTGSGVLDASGGDTTEACRSSAPGGGGGGRIALWVDDLGSFDVSSGARAWGGTLLECGASLYAAPGTVLIRQATDSDGHLRIAQGGGAGLSVPATVLPAIGKGTIGAVIPTGADLWIGDADPAKLFSLGVTGMWVRVDGVDYPVIGESADRRQLLLEGAAGAVEAGDSYVGVYKFDSITVTGDAHLVLRDEDETGNYQVDPGSTYTEYDLDPPAVTVTSPAAGTLFVAGEPVAIAADVTDLNGVVSVTFRLGDQSFVDTEAPYEWTTAAPVVAVEEDVDIEIESVDGEANVGLVLHTIRVRPLAPGDPPVVTIGCPSPGARLAPGTGLDFAVTATHDDGVERVELFVDGAATPAATDFGAPYDFRYDVPVGALDGDVVSLTFRARSFGGVYGEIVYPVQVVAGNVVTADTFVSSADASLDGSSVIVAGGTLTLEGAHTFRDLVVLDGAAVTHPATTTSGVERLELTLTRDLFVACGATVEASGLGYPDGHTYGGPVSTAASRGGSHGGQGGGSDATDGVYGNLFDPRDPGAGGAEVSGGAGGGVIRIGAGGVAMIDGSVRADGVTASGQPAGAGGSVRIDAAAISGLGILEASGGGGSSIARPAGGGGRIALYGASIDDGLVDRTLAAGGDASTSELRGAAGTIFVKEDAQSFGELILDAAGIDSDPPTELLGFVPGVLDSVGVSTVTDDGADFVHDLTGMDAYFEGDTSVLWPIAGHDHHGQTLTLDTSVEPLMALAGDAYAGLYRFDRVVVRGGASAVTRAGVQSATAPEVEAGSSWTEEHLPSVTITSPGDAQVFNSGSTVTVTVQADDLFGVSSIDLSMGAQTATVTEAPYSASFVAPIVSTSTGFAVTAVLRDRAGYEVTDSITVQVEPLSDGAAPIVSLAPCPRDGDAAIPSSAVALAFSAIDNSQIESWRVLVNGVLEHEVTGVNQASVAASYSWTVPAGAAPGTSYVLRVEARDYGGDTGFASRTLTVPAGPILSGSQSIDSTWNGTDLALAAGTFTVTEPVSLQSLFLADGAVVVPQTGTDLDLDVAGELRVQCGAALDASSLGYPGGVYNAQMGGAPSWVTGSSPDAGGSHGGAGSLGYDGPGPAGDVYDSVYRPRLGGGGGALDYNVSGRWGGAGGGVIDLTVGTLVLDGEIRAMGETRQYDKREAGGAGGTIRVVAGQIQGTGRIDVSGGGSSMCGTTDWVGSGGGGRVALEGTLVGFDVASHVEAQGGHQLGCSANYLDSGAAGTVYVLEPGGVYGDLWIDAGTEWDGTEHTGPATELPSLGAGTVTATEVAGSDLWVTPSSPLAPRWDGAWMVLVDGSGSDLGAFEVLSVDEAGRALLLGAGGAATAASFRGEYRFDAVTLLNGAGLVTSDRLEAGSVLAEGSSRLPAAVEVTGDLTIAAGSTVTPAEGGELKLEVAGTLRVEAGAVLDASYLGFAGGVYNAQVGGAPAWVTGSSPDAGGSHGGAGSLGYDGPGPAGEVFDSVYRPRLGGGGGALDYNVSGRWGGAGGGVIDLAVGTLVLDGEIRAVGETRQYDKREAGGAGGTVRVVAGQIQGTGRIDVSGGDEEHCGSGDKVGAGGGGRVAIAGSLVGFDVASQVSAQAGHLFSCGSTLAGYAAPGTIFVAEPGSVYGDLRIDAGTETDGTERIGPVTELPALGTGTVSSTEVAGADLWVTAASPLAPRWDGAWMVLVDVSGSDLGTFEVLSVDGAGRALLEGAGGIATAASFRGEYRFDAVTLSNGAGLVASDRLEVTSMLAEGSSRLPAIVEVTGDLTIAAGSTVTPAVGGELRLEVAGTLRVESGAVLDASYLGYAGGVQNAQVGGAPSWVTGSSPDAGGSHGGAGSLGYDGPGPAGEVFDSVYRPRLGGGGGALDYNVSGRWGGAGGGVVDLTVGTLVLDGEIRTLGEERRYEYREAAGAGGTVRIVAGQIEGTGSIDASGAASTYCGNGEEVGAGGGGRVALEGTLLGFDAATQVKAFGGMKKNCGSTIEGYGAPGTIYVAEPTGTYGDLYVHATVSLGTAHPNTVLPTPGTGTVGVATVDASDPADLWIEPQDPVALFDLGVTGMWLRIGGSDYRVLDQSADRRTVLLDGAAGLVSVGDGYAGVYKFDTVTVRGGAILEFLDTAEATTFDVDADSLVITPQ